MMTVWTAILPRKTSVSYKTQMWPEAIEGRVAKATPGKLVSVNRKKTVF